ncbi:MAG: hypothetical protein WC635_12290 [Bacteriovorax sp.]|jgi:hypothetical protein
MRIFLFSLLILNFTIPFIFQNTSQAQIAVKKELEETKDQQFLNNGAVCFISKKEQDEAKDYIIGSMENEKLKLKIALTLTQIRIMNKLKFEDINCGLRYFLELYYGKSGRRWGNDNYDSWNSNHILEYIKVMELVRSDSKYKTDFEKNIINSSDLNFYFGIMDRFPDSYNFIDPSLARKAFSDNLLSSGNNRSFRSEELKVFFELFYSKGIAPSRELNNYLKTILNKPFEFGSSGYRPFVFAGSGYMPVYLENVNDLAYNDLFKYVFANVPSGGIANLQDFSNILLVKELYASKYVPENYKCIFAKDTLIKIIAKFTREDMYFLNSINNACLKETLADYNRFTIPAKGCPEIVFKINEDHASLLSKMSSEFSKSWVECRKTCAAKETCLSVKDSNGVYNFINSKYGKDLGLFDEIKNRNVNKINNNMFLTYDYKAVGICTAANKCGEKDLSCLTSDIIKKVNAEILTANYQKCNVDEDCYVYKSDFSGCVEFAINVNPCVTMSTNSVRGNAQCYPTNNFISARLESISAQCGFQFIRGGCHSFGSSSSSMTKAKCEKNICVLAR